MPAIYKPSRIAFAMQTEVAPGSNGGYGGITTVSAHILFDFADPRRLLTDQALWPLVAEQMPQGSLFDKCQVKPRAELIVAGAALAPGDRPITGCRVLARLGSIEKSLAVFGDRAWRRTDRGIEMLEAMPFDRMPIDETRAFGGPDFKLNPRGRGHNARQIVDSGYDAPLPNIEGANRLIRSIDDAPAPAHFGPLALDDPQRLRYAGTYDQHWTKNVSPLKPEDFNPLFHCDAPADQRIDGHFEGNEAFSVAGMSRGEGIIGGRLPNLRLRGFYQSLADDGFHEIRLACDTVTLFPNVTKAIVSYHGLIRGEDRFGEDIKAVMLAAEHAEDASRPQDYYLNVYRLRSAPDEAHKHALSDFQLMPEVDPSIISSKRQAKLERARQDRIDFMENAAWSARKEVEAMGMPPSIVPPPYMDIVDELPLVAMPTSEEIECGDVDIAEIIDDVEALRVALMEKSDKELAKAELQRRAIVKSTPPSMLSDFVRKPIVDDAHMDRFPDLAIDGEVAGGFAQLESLTGDLEDPFASLNRNVAGEGFDEAWSVLGKVLDGIDGIDEDDAAASEEQFQRACARALGLPEGSLLHQAREAFADISLDGLDQPEFPGDATDGLGAAVQSVLDGPAAPGKQNSPDLGDIFDAVPLDIDEAAIRDGAGDAGEKIRKIVPHLISDDPDGDPLRDLIARTNAMAPTPDPEEAARPLRERIGTAMASIGGRLDEAEDEVAAVMLTARQSSPMAIFPSDAFKQGVAQRFGDFVRENLSRGHDFKGADLAGADLRGVDLRGRDLSATLFEQADLTGATFEGANLDGAVFAGATLDGADFTGASLDKANISRASLRGTRLDGCRLAGCTVIETDFSEMSAREVRLTQCVLIDCTLDNADFGGSLIADLQVLKGRADGLMMDRVQLERSSLIALSLKNASFTDCSLDRIAIADADARGAVFSGATFRSVCFMGTNDLTRSRFDGISADESSWLTAKLDESCFLRARVHGCLFNDCAMTAADLRAGSFRESQFNKSILIDSDLFAANLFSASLFKTDLRRASLRGANLYSANLLETKLGSCDLSGANLAMTMLELPAHA